MTDLSLELWLVAGTLLLLLVMILLVSSRAWRRRRPEQVRRWEQLDAVHTVRERRLRGSRFMEWDESMDGQRYTLSGGTCMAMVTHDLGRLWVAQLVRMGVAIEHESFETLTDAQAWCFTRLAELRVSGNCS